MEEKPHTYACRVTRAIPMNWMAKCQMHTLAVIDMYFFLRKKWAHVAVNGRKIMTEENPILFSKSYSHTLKAEYAQQYNMACGTGTI
jgi:hypothetical protein